MKPQVDGMNSQPQQKPNDISSMISSVMPEIQSIMGKVGLGGALPQMSNDNFIHDDINKTANQVNGGMNGNGFNPSHSAQDALGATITGMPQLPDPSKRSKWQKATAMFVGGGDGYKAGQDVIYGRHDREIADWMKKAALQERAATNENQDNTSARLYDQNIRIDQDRDTKQQQANAIAEGKLADANARTKIMEGRAETYRQMAKGGVPLFDERTGKGYMTYKDGTSVEIDPSHIPEEELINAKAAAQQRINANRPGSGSAGEVVFQPMDENGRPLPPVVVNKGSGTSRPITAPGGKTPLPSGKVQSPDAKFKTDSMTYGKFINDKNISDQFAAKGKKPVDYFDMTPEGQIIGLKARSKFTDPGDLAIYDYIYNYFNGKK